MKRHIVRRFWILLLGVLSACGTPLPAAEPTELPPVTEIMETSIPSASVTPTRSITPSPSPSFTKEPSSTEPPTLTATPAVDVEVNLGVVSFVIPAGLADSAELEITREEEFPFVSPSTTPYPEHWVIHLKGYRMSPTDQDPTIIIFHTDEFAEFDADVVDSLKKLQTDPKQPPDPNLFIYFRHFIAQILRLESPGSVGIRYLVQYLISMIDEVSTDFPINNKQIFYYYRGLSRDGGYYISAVMPVDASFLEPSYEAGNMPPEGGVPFPEDADEETFGRYLQEVERLVNTSKPDDWRPSLLLLDKLVKSVRIGG